MLHMAAVFAVYLLTDSSCQEVIRIVFLISGSVNGVVAVYVCLHILNAWIAVFLYAKYVLKKSFAEMYLGKPYPALRWCVVAVIMPLAVNLSYFIFTDGEFQMGQFTQGKLIYLVFYDIFSWGLRIAVTEGMFFWGLLFSILRKEFGKKGGIIISAFFYAASGFALENRFAGLGIDDFWMFVLKFLMGLAFALVTCETGSVWSAVAIHALYNALSGDGYILHIDTRHTGYPAVFTYTAESGSRFFTEMPLPALVGFLAMIMAVVARGNKDRNRAMPD